MDYFSEENVETCEEHGLDPFIATWRFQTLRAAGAGAGGARPIPKDATATQRMARKTRTKKGRKLYSRRKTILEPGSAKSALFKTAGRRRSAASQPPAPNGASST